MARCLSTATEKHYGHDSFGYQKPSCTRFFLPLAKGSSRFPTRWQHNGWPDYPRCQTPWIEAECRAMRNVQGEAGWGGNLLPLTGVKTKDFGMLSPPRTAAGTDPTACNDAGMREALHHQSQFYGVLPGAMRRYFRFEEVFPAHLWCQAITACAQPDFRTFPVIKSLGD